MDIETHKFTDSSIFVARCEGVAEVQQAVDAIFDRHSALLPRSKEALIFLKPNLNNDLNALTGNSTDLRILACVIFALKERGYGNITVGDGSNVGIDRKKIDTFARLKVDRLAHSLGVEVLNLNGAPSKEVLLAKGLKARVAAICFEAALFINLPKIKTHAEAKLSACLKNMVGTLAGGEQKKKMHYSLQSNLVKINEQVRPHLHIVDGLIAMEGNGPGDGHPRKLGLVLAGEDPFLVDAFCARIVGFGEGGVPYLEIARKKGYLKGADIALLRSCEVITDILKPPPVKLSTRILGHNMFMGLRDVVRPAFDNRVVMGLLYRKGIVQDVYNRDDARIEKISLDKEKCTDCGACIDYCPVKLPVTAMEFDFSADKGCIECLYCAFVCPEEAIKFEGTLGYLQFYLQKYSAHMKELGAGYGNGRKG